MKIKRAIISVSNKRGLAEFAKLLTDRNIEIISSGGTARYLQEKKIQVIPVQNVTGFDEILNGRVKTLHPRIHGAILADRNSKKHIEEINKLDIDPIELVVVNLYPFQHVAENNPDNFNKIVENIDIGGPTLIRAAAKNHSSVMVVIDPDDYERVIYLMDKNNGEIPFEVRQEFAQKAFTHTASYDAAISQYFSSLNRENADLPHEPFIMIYNEAKELRYGENPHQKASRYRQVDNHGQSILSAKVLSGKPMSFNNYMDAQAAINAAAVFTEPAAVIVKHQTPCGAAVDTDLGMAYEKAYACDPMSAFGGIVALNRPVNLDVAKTIHTTKFLEVIIAPEFDAEAIMLLKRKKTRRILQFDMVNLLQKRWDIRWFPDGLLCQEYDPVNDDPSTFDFIGDDPLNNEILREIDFAWRICACIKSNAIVLTKNLATVGIGAGQVSRIDAAKIAVRKAEERVQGAIMASDAFIPFPDVVELAAENGVKYVVQPGGSKGDQAVIEVCRERHINLIMTHQRHFKH